MVILQGFVDDSGTTQGNIFALAGFLSTAERWAAFSDEWDLICSRVPKTPNFKMNKVRQSVGPRLTDRQLLERTQELTELTRRRAMYRVDVVTARPNYERIVKGQVPKEIDSIYFVLFLNMIFTTARLMEMQNLDGTVDFVFDNQGSATEEKCVRWYRWIRDHPEVPENVKRRLGRAPDFRDDDLVLPLKAADMYAWHLRRHLNKEQPKKIPPGEYLESIGKMFGASCQIRPQDLASLVYSIKHGLAVQAQCGFLLSENQQERDPLFP